jgi:predicted transcriptional regulator
MPAPTVKGYLITSITEALKDQLSAAATTISGLFKRLTSIEALLPNRQKEKHQTQERLLQQLQRG